MARRRPITFEYNMPSTGEDSASNLAVFLVLNTGSCLGHWRGHMRAADQRALFGDFFGKGLVVIDGERESLRHWRKVCFGTDSDCTADYCWRDLPS